MGTRSPPAGIFKCKPSHAPAAAVASVSIRDRTLVSPDWVEAVETALLTGCSGPSHSPATSDAVNTTKITRRYCIIATRSGSAPNSCDIATIAEAAPAEVPHAAVEPGRLPNRTSSHPTSVLAAIVPKTAAVIKGQLWRKEVRRAAVMACAIKQPISACPAINALRGKRIVAPARAHRMPISMGPTRKEAGRANRSSTRARISDAQTATAHCRAGRIDPKVHLLPS